MTFDTSLVDLNPNASFSTTESDASDFGTAQYSTAAPTIQPPSLFDEQSQETAKSSQTRSPLSESSTPVQRIATKEAYEQWAEVYDSDGNMLQAVDDLELTTLLPQFLHRIQTSHSMPNVSLLDLGCGSGRNTKKLLDFSLAPGRRSTVVGLDFSRAYFSTLSALLIPGGLALITNMHSDMGAKSQAGFVNKDGVKVQGRSFAHTVQDSINEANRAGFELLDVRERIVKREDMESGAIGERGWKWLGIKIWDVRENT
ncbi:hypothetical protein ACEQ8H_002071 [Pleosporales sp. CAS-2024a]